MKLPTDRALIRRYDVAARLGLLPNAYATPGVH